MMTDTTRFCRFSLNLFLTIAIVSLAIAGCTDSSPGRTTSTSAGLQELPTFNRDIAPIIFNNCTGCHRPGEIAPFELVTYKDVHKRAKQIAMVTASRYMPPWLPISEPGHFMSQRSLSDREIATIKKWVKSGAPEGDPADLPLQPKFKEGWQLGEPDMIVTMPEPYVLAAEGTDVFRNFVIPVPIQSRRHVRAVEFRPDNLKVVHHGRLEIDRTPSSRQADDQDPELGYAGMINVGAQSPDGHWLGWTPGKRPFVSGEGMAWILDRGTDFVVQLRMLPSGKPEKVQLRIGLFFDENPPKQLPFVFMIGSNSMDIPPGEKMNFCLC